MGCVYSNHSNIGINIRTDHSSACNPAVVKLNRHLLCRFDHMRIGNEVSLVVINPPCPTRIQPAGTIDRLRFNMNHRRFDRVTNRGNRAIHPAQDVVLCKHIASNRYSSPLLSDSIPIHQLRNDKEHHRNNHENDQCWRNSHKLSHSSVLQDPSRNNFQD